MLRVRTTSSRLCDGVSRRDLLAVGSLEMLGLAARPPAAGAGIAGEKLPPSFGRAKRCVLLFLTGGPPQHDTWDMKPDAPAEVRGEFRPIDTDVPGVQVCELFPRLARVASRFQIVRSVTHIDTVHTSAGYTMLTGVPHPLANVSTAALIRPLPTDHPHFGSILAKARPGSGTTPVFASLPEVIKDAAVPRPTVRSVSDQRRRSHAEVSSAGDHARGGCHLGAAERAAVSSRSDRTATHGARAPATGGRSR
jgi:hypothetical protein